MIKVVFIFLFWLFLVDHFHPFSEKVMNNKTKLDAHARPHARAHRHPHAHPHTHAHIHVPFVIFCEVVIIALSRIVIFCVIVPLKKMALSIVVVSMGGPGVARFVTAFFTPVTTPVVNTATVVTFAT